MRNGFDLGFSAAKNYVVSVAYFVREGEVGGGNKLDYRQIKRYYDTSLQYRKEHNRRK